MGKSKGVILVHGTFDTESRWSNVGTKAAPTFYDAVVHLNPEADVVTYYWDGRNSHKSRWEAARKLAEKLEGQARLNSAPDLVLVGHSHGGTISHYAIRMLSKQAKRRICGVMTIGSKRCPAPTFLRVERHEIWHWLMSVREFLHGRSNGASHKWRETAA